MFTNLPVCRACEAVELPKISDINLNRLYVFSNGSQDVLETLQSRENLSHRLYQWSDIEPLVAKGCLKKKRIAAYHHRSKAIPFNPEEHAEFRFHQRANRELDYREIEQFYLHIVVLDEILQFWDYDTLHTRSPILIELALFNEFRYLFDYSWSPKPTRQEQVEEYIRVARHWLEEATWLRRPWRLSAFPQTPRCSVSNPFARQCHKDIDLEAFSEHQRQCRLRRALIQAYPAILSNPAVWCRCINFSTSQFDESVSLAACVRSLVNYSKLPDIDFELLTNPCGDDVRLMRTGKDLKPRFYNRSHYEEEDVTAKKVAVVSIRNDSSQIRLLESDARVQFWYEGRIHDISETRRY